MADEEWDGQLDVSDEEYDQQDRVRCENGGWKTLHAVGMRRFGGEGTGVTPGVEVSFVVVDDLEADDGVDDQGRLCRSTFFLTRGAVFKLARYGRHIGLPDQKLDVFDDGQLEELLSFDYIEGEVEMESYNDSQGRERFAPVVDLEWRPFVGEPGDGWAEIVTKGQELHSDIMSKIEERESKPKARGGKAKAKSRGGRSSRRSGRNANVGEHGF